MLCLAAGHGCLGLLGSWAVRSSKWIAYFQHN